MPKRTNKIKRKICLITGSRADYDLLKPLIYDIKKDPQFSLQLIVTGTCLLRQNLAKPINK